MKRLENKVAIITGAANGQGKAEAILFTQHGANVVITDIDEESLTKTAKEISDLGGTVLAIKHNVSTEEDWKNVIELTIKEFGKLDILINNAGILLRNSLEDTTLDEFEKIQAVNTRGTFLGMKHAAALMKESGGGSIINISSIYGLVGSKGSIAYHSSKGAIRLMTKAAAIDLSKNYIRVNSIHPGVIETAMSNEIVKNGVHPLKVYVPWPELGQPEDIANGALYLASDESKYVTGSELVIDGGYSAQ
ncbi:short-chain dehydrogenase [Ureibacillus massiliensis 4400831 = CIP 108448 = CCUG 49529]|uniref:Short-chain dehydrogenase n=1 Tax=Ureibacillus massiliensis 4400831 = CIP 108448 = CCUG 49529 TaxID=1211035 RepID=A0A0A3J381_9BACL|nr:glucose 1-dehydrogenase [Ureibacillus massiliensis]KGR90160.1 short-chain dehydrogenase [Ureibacillus massiliensis 4400831 = CIP 108448 = CCUG 49529]